MTDIARQDEEIEILKAIYNEDCVISKFNQQGNRIVDIFVDENITIRATLPSTYPSKDCPVFELLGRNINKHDRSRAIDEFYSIYNNSQNDVILFSCTEWIKQNMSAVENALEEAACEYDEDPGIKSDTCRSSFENACRNEDLLSRIYHGESLVDRKSVFQAHVAAIYNPDEASEIVSILKQDRKISRATHNIIAYRVVSDSSSGPPIVYADNDDDGEHGAGPKLAELLSLIGAQNVIVVVSRWYGGIQLGPDRFKHIANVARTAIEHCGLCSRSESSSSGKSKFASKKAGR